MRLRDLLDDDAPEDAVLADLGLPWWFDRALLGLGGLVIVASAIGSLVDDDGDDLVNLAVLGLVALPWCVWIARQQLPSPAAAAAWILGPAAALVGVELGDRVAALGFAPGFVLNLGLLTLVGCVFAPRRHATLIIAATYLVFTVRSLLSEVPAAEASWLLALTFVVAGVLGIRICAITIAESQQALAERDALVERRAVAREVQDVVARSLAVTLRQVAAARGAVDRGAIADAVEALEDAERHGRATLTNVRRTVGVLRTDHEGGVGLAQPRLDDVATLVAGHRTAGRPVRFSLRGDVDRAPAAVGLAVHRLVDAALSDASHPDSRPTGVTGVTGVAVVIEEKATTLEIVRLTGTGDEGATLAVMRERTSAAGGTLTVERHSQDGTSIVSVRLPNGPAGEAR